MGGREKKVDVMGIIEDIGCRRVLDPSTASCVQCEPSRTTRLHARPVGSCCQPYATRDGG